MVQNRPPPAGALDAVEERLRLGLIVDLDGGFAEVVRTHERVVASVALPRWGENTTRSRQSMSPAASAGSRSKTSKPAPAMTPWRSASTSAASSTSAS